jgi:hypothetical protein
VLLTRPADREMSQHCALLRRSELAIREGIQLARQLFTIGH